MNRMFVTIRAEFFQVQLTRCIVSILLSNISGNAPRFFIQTISDTTGTFQNNYYSDIFTLSHEPPLDFEFTQFFYFRFEPKRRRKEWKINRREVANSKSNSIVKDFVAINRVIKLLSNTNISNYQLFPILVFHLASCMILNSLPSTHISISVLPILTRTRVSMRFNPLLFFTLSFLS